MKPFLCLVDGPHSTNTFALLILQPLFKKILLEYTQMYVDSQAMAGWFSILHMVWFCLQPFPASLSFPVSQLFASGGQSIGVSASASVFPMNIQDWFPLGLTGLISLQYKGLSRVSSNTTVQKHQFFGAQLSSQSNSRIHTWLLEKPQPWLDRLLFKKPQKKRLRSYVPTITFLRIYSTEIIRYANVHMFKHVYYL